MTKWEHLHHVGKSIVTVSVALIALGVNFLEEDFSWSHATLCLAIAYCLLAATVVLSLWSMAAVSNLLPRRPGGPARVASTSRAVRPANAAFFLFAIAVLLLTTVGVIEVLSGPEDSNGIESGIRLTILEYWQSA